MIRYINCFRKKPTMSDDEFRRHWCSEEFNNLVRRVVDLSHATRYAKNLTLHVQAAQTLTQDRGIGEPYDAVLEYWWPDARHFTDYYENDAAKALMREMADVQAQFIDLSRSTAFFTEGE